MTPQTDITEETPNADAISARPDHVPEKFWDAKTGTVRLDALLKSYRELEKKLSAIAAAPETEDAKAGFLKSLGHPDTPDDYKIDCAHGLFKPDAELNARLHAKGFTQDQAQEVYALAAEKLVPMILDIVADANAENEIAALTAEFGGREKWQETSRQLLAFGRKHVDPQTMSALCSSCEGVRTLYKMMQAESAPAGESEAVNERDVKSLQAMMRDPRYWRDRDPAFIAKVTAGFERVYGEG